MSTPVVWVQLYYEEKDKPEKGVTQIASTDVPFGNIGGLARKLKEIRERALNHCDAEDLSVYPPGTTSFSKDNAKDPGDPVPNGATCTSKKPWIAVAPAPPQKPQADATSKRFKADDTGQDRIAEMLTGGKYSEAFNELKKQATGYMFDLQAELNSVCIPRKMETWDAKGELRRQLITQREEIRSHLVDPENPGNRDSRIIAVRLGTGCGKTHLLLEAKTFLSAALIYITYNKEQFDLLDSDRGYPRHAILLRILLHLCGASNVGSAKFIHRHMNDFGKIPVEDLRELVVRALLSIRTRDIVIGVDEIMKLASGSQVEEDVKGVGGHKNNLEAVQSMMSELGEVAYAFYTRNQRMRNRLYTRDHRMCTVLVTSLNNEPFATVSERDVLPWIPPPPDAAAIKHITSKFNHGNEEQCAAMTTAAAGYHYRSIAYAVETMSRPNDPAPLEIFNNVRSKVKPSDVEDLPFLKQYVIEQCKGHDATNADYERSRKRVEHYLDGGGAVPPALICSAFDVRVGNHEDPVHNMFYWNPSFMDAAKHLEAFGLNFDLYRALHEIPVVPKKAKVHGQEGAKPSSWFYGLLFSETMKVSKKALFATKSEGKTRSVYATDEINKVATTTYYYPSVDNHPWIDRAYVASHKETKEDCLVLVQDKVNDDVPKTVKNLNDAADKLKDRFPRILLVVNVIGAGASRKQEELRYPYVLARKKEDELVNFYSASFAPIAEYVRSRHELAGRPPTARELASGGNLEAAAR